MTEEGRYLVFLVEQYAAHKGISGSEAMRLFQANNLLAYIQDMYYTYHTERVENALADLDARIEGR